MQIESIILRKAGTTVRLGDTVYHFAPTAGDPRHIAEVADTEHAQTFLAIREGYRIPKSGKPAAPKQDSEAETKAKAEAAAKAKAEAKAQAEAEVAKADAEAKAKAKAEANK